MHGEVGVESCPGVGTTFRVALWFGIGAPRNPANSLPSQITGARVLVVDDNPVARDILAANLEKLGLRVDAAGSAREAYAAILQAPLDDPCAVAFMDHHMPEIDGIHATRTILSEFPENRRPRVIMATGAGEMRDAAELAGAVGFLIKPVTYSSVRDALLRAFNAMDSERETDTAPDRPDLSGIRVLLAEDNTINREIVVELLTSVHASVETVNNGAELLEILRCSPHPHSARPGDQQIDEQPPDFDVLLIDLQMPVMDGHEAARAIRAYRRYDNLPMVALTGHAFVHERLQCLSEGMNEHIAKPVEPALLYRTVQKFAGRRQSHAADYNQNPNGFLALAGVLDEAAGLRYVGGNASLHRSLLRDFSQHCRRQLLSVREALATGDIVLAKRVTHTVFGLSQTFGAGALNAAAARLYAHQLETHLQAFEAALLGVSTAIESLSPSPLWPNHQSSLASSSISPKSALRSSIC
jgi:CheY-like chemotaxis protein/HPt (histidine-containing phosphotransfer) domain-containing protein